MHTDLITGAQATKRDDIAGLLSMASHPGTDFGAKEDFVNHAGFLALNEAVRCDKLGRVDEANAWDAVYMACQYSTIHDAREALRAI